MSKSVSDKLGKYYSEKFDEHGPSSLGVDWGADEKKMFLRYEKMLNVTERRTIARPTLLDAGCGFGGLLNYAKSRNIDLDYTGIDVAGNMITWAKKNVPGGVFIEGEILNHSFDTPFDFVVCNGILTQKLDVSGLEMDRFASKLIKKMFSICKYGIAFNVMTTKVNYYSNNLYYRNPAELLAWCIGEITPHVKLDHSYPLYEYTVYLYREPA